ncbi:MAG: hypothetical protein ACRDTX_14320 [Pseudonocardiaceae bacterium]
MSEADRRGEAGAGGAVVIEQPLMLVRYRPGVICPSAGTVHLVPVPDHRESGVAAALCGGRLFGEQIESVRPGEGVPCPACLANRAIALGPSQAGSPGPDGGDAEALSGSRYSEWGWPVSQDRDLIQLSLDGDASAIAIPISLSSEVTRVLTDRHCAPAVLAHPYAPEHHMVLTGEKFGAALPWPTDVYQVSGSVMLPPTMTVSGPVTWVHPPAKDSLRLSREIDVFGALRAAIID